jgi:hypothetical protein
MIRVIMRKRYRDVMKSQILFISIGFGILFSIILVGSLADEQGFRWSVFGIFTAYLVSLGGQGLWLAWRLYRLGEGSLNLTFAKVIGVGVK